MALKITSGQWISAGRENRNQRNTKREQFFREAGVTPASSLRDIHVSGATRLSKVIALFGHASGDRIDDPNLKAIAGLMAAEIGQLGLSAPSVTPLQELKSLGVIGFSPDVLKAFFSADHITTLEWSTSD